MDVFLQDVKKKQLNLVLKLDHQIVVPSFIKKIAKYMFKNCEMLTKIEFEKDSQLRLIDDCSFCGTKIKKYLIPSHVIKIGRFAFSGCNNLKEIEFADYYELQVIDEFAFSGLQIECFTIPSNITEIREYAFQHSYFLSIDFAQKSELRKN